MPVRILGALWAVFVVVMLGGPATAQQGGQSKVELLWLGQSAMRIGTPGGKHILVDPWITQNPKTPAEWKDLAKLGKIDVVLVTHGHGDHFGDAATIAKQQNVQMWGPAGLQNTLYELGILTPELRRA
jgi:L-ascorbate metabolism protein UlaG (beta-lactamase superfamily)